MFVCVYIHYVLCNGCLLPNIILIGLIFILLSLAYTHSMQAYSSYLNKVDLTLILRDRRISPGYRGKGTQSFKARVRSPRMDIYYIYIYCKEYQGEHR